MATTRTSFPGRASRTSRPSEPRDTIPDPPRRSRDPGNRATPVVQPPGARYPVYIDLGSEARSARARAWAADHAGYLAAGIVGLGLGAGLAILLRRGSGGPATGTSPAVSVTQVPGTAPAVPPASPGTAPVPASLPLGTVVASVAFHLRPTPVLASIGTEYPAGSVLTLLERGTLMRNNQTLYRVRTTSGAEGWTFVTPDEIRH